MARSAAQARKKKTPKSEPEQVAPPVEEVPPAETEDAGEPPEAEEDMDVNLEPTEGEEDVIEPSDEILEDDNNNDAEDLAGDEVTEEDLIAEDEEAEAEDEEGEGEEEAGGDGEEQAADEEGGENGESKKRKATGKQPAAKKIKVEPKPVRMNLYVKQMATETFDNSLETFLRDNEVELKEFKANSDPVWTLAGQLTLTKPEDKEKTLNLTGSELESQEVKFEAIEEPIESEDSLKKLQAPDEVILFVRNFLKTTTDEDLKKLFPTCVELHVPQKNGRSKGFAFIQFGSKDEVQEMIKNKQGVLCAGKKLSLSRFSSRSAADKLASRTAKLQKTKDLPGNSQNKVLFVGNLSFDTREDKIMKIFRTAETVKILRFANTGKSKGVAFIEFRTPMAARKAFEKFSNAKIDGRAINLEYADQDKFKAGDRGPNTMNRDTGRRLSGGGGRPMQGFNSGGRQLRGNQIRSLLDNMQYERSMEYDNRFNRMGSGMGMGLGRISLDSSMGLDAGFGGRMGMDNTFGARMGMDSGLGGRMSLDGGLGRRMGMDAGYGMGDSMGIDSGYSGRMRSMDTGLSNYGSRMGGMDGGNFGGGFKSRGMNTNRMRQGNRKSWN